MHARAHQRTRSTMCAQVEALKPGVLMWENVAPITWRHKNVNGEWCKPQVDKLLFARV